MLRSVLALTGILATLGYAVSAHSAMTARGSDAPALQDFCARLNIEVLRAIAAVEGPDAIRSPDSGKVATIRGQILLALKSDASEAAVMNLRPFVSPATTKARNGEMFVNTVSMTGRALGLAGSKTVTVYDPDELRYLPMVQEGQHVLVIATPKYFNTSSNVLTKDRIALLLSQVQNHRLKVSVVNSGASSESKDLAALSGIAMLTHGRLMNLKPGVDDCSPQVVDPKNQT